MAMGYFRVDAEGAYFQAQSNSQGDVLLYIGPPNQSEALEVKLPANTAEMLARGLLGLAAQSRISEVRS